MATIIPFRPPAQRAATKQRGQAATILLFTGVRYERWEGEEGDRRAGRSGGKRRGGDRRQRRRSRA